MIDPILSIAISMQANKGVYALLLGSGVSRTSGIPTGWEVVQDLIRTIATLKGEACEPSPDEWFRTTFNLEPDYSEVISQVAKSPSERGQVLRRYFEPTDDERSQGLKQPTASHKAIAELVSKGYIRVILTTNFDRLLEQALVDSGIQPAVISTPDACGGALPLAHARCSMIKVNGDYLDTRIKNTRGELEEYASEIKQLLAQIFDEYGLIICGWSADWDIALRDAIQRSPNQRFTTYWTQRGQLSVAADELFASRNAVSVPISDADSFFHELKEKVEALERLTINDTISPKVAVARLKKYLASDSNKIDMRDLFAEETERVSLLLSGANFHDPPYDTRITGDLMVERFTRYEQSLDTLVQIAACGAYWATPHQHSPILDSLKRIADQKEPSVRSTFWVRFRRYPSLLIMYAMGLGALANSNYTFLRALLYLKIRTDSGKPEQGIAALLYDQAVMEIGNQKVLPGRQNEHTPLSNHLSVVLRDPLRHYLPDDLSYDQTFDLFEYLLALVHCDLKNSLQDIAHKKSSDPDFVLRGPIGRFASKDLENGVATQSALNDDGQPTDPFSKALEVGFFEANTGKYTDIKQGYDRLILLVRQEWGVYW